MMQAQAETPSPSFYVTGGTLEGDAPSYVSRSADEELFASLRRGEFSYILTSRQMGKSSLMVRTSERLRKNGIVAVTIDLTSIGQNLTVDQWYNDMLEKLGERLKLEKEMEDYWLNKQHLSPLQKWRSALTDVMLKRINEPVVIFIDEIDVVRRLPFSTDEFFACIRELYNRRTEDATLKRLTFCLLGVASPSDLIRDTRLTPFNIGNRIELRDFEVSQALVLAKGLKQDAEQNRILIDRVTHWTGGHPYLTQRLCKAVAKAKEGTITKAGDVDRLCDDLFFSSRAKEGDDNLAFVRERILASEVDRSSLLDLYEKVRQGKRVRDNDSSRRINVLRLSGITRVRDGYLEVRNRIYHRVFDKMWIDANMPDAELRERRAALIKGRIQTAAIASVILVLMLALYSYAITQRNIATASLKALEEERLKLQETNQRLREQTAMLEQSALKLKQQSWDLKEALTDKESQRQLAKAAQAKAEAKAAEAQQAEAESNRLAYAAQISLAQKEWEDNNIDTAVNYLDSIRSKQAKEEFEWSYLWGLTHREPVELKYADDVRAATYSPDGRFIATVTSSELTVIAPKTGQKWQMQLNSHDPAKCLILLNKDEPTAIVADREKIWTYDTKHAAKTEKLPQGGSKIAPAISPDGTLVAFSNEEGLVKTWQIGGGPLLRLGGHSQEINRLLFSPNGQFLASTDVRDKIKLWDVKNNQELKLKQPGVAILDITFSPNSGMLLINTHDFLLGYTISSAKPPAGRRKPPNQESTALTQESAGTLAPKPGQPPNPNEEGNNLTSQIGDPKVISYQYLDEKLTDFTLMKFSPKEDYFATAEKDGTIRVWNVADFGFHFKIGNGQPKELAESEDFGTALKAKTPVAIFVQSPPSPITSLSFSGNGKLLSSSLDKTTRIWDLKDKQRDDINLEGEIYALAFTQKRNLLAVGGGMKEVADEIGETSKPKPRGFVRLFDMTTNEELLRPFPQAKAFVNALAFSPDASKLVYGSGDKMVRIYDFDHPDKTKTLRGHLASIWAVAFSPDGKIVASASADHTVRLWDVKSGTLQATLRGHTNCVEALAFSKDGHLLASGGWDNQIIIWDISKEQPKRLREIYIGASVITTLAFVPETMMLGRVRGPGRLIAGFANGKLEIFDANTRKQESIIFPTQHRAAVRSIAFAPNQQTLATVSADGKVKLWDATLPQQTVTLSDHEDQVWAVAFVATISGKQMIATAGKDGKVKLWTLSNPGQLVDKNDQKPVAQKAAH